MYVVARRLREGRSVAVDEIHGVLLRIKVASECVIFQQAKPVPSDVRHRGLRKRRRRRAIPASTNTKNNEARNQPQYKIMTNHVYVAHYPQPPEPRLFNRASTQ